MNARWLAGLMGILLLPAAVQAWDVQGGYRVCALMEDDHDRMKCLEIVRDATRPYPRVIEEICERLETGSLKNRVLDATKDKVFPSGAAEVCLPLAQEDRVQDLLGCLKAAGTVSPLTRKEQSNVMDVDVQDWSSHARAVDAAERNARARCFGWSYYSFTDPQWKSRACWRTTHSQRYTDYTLGSRPARTRRGTEYNSFHIVPVERVRVFYRHHCRASYYCWRRVKDYSNVQGE